MKIGKIILALSVALFASCASNKSVTGGTSLPSGKTSAGETSAVSESLRLVQRVADNNVYVANILADADFTLNMGTNKISCPAKLSMRKDECIRLQLLLPILRTELARLEFTPTYVLLIDRYHKEYIKASYDDVSFLADNGLSFYSLQALFWNQLLLPGATKVAEGDLRKFDVNITPNAASAPVTLNSGKMTYKWSVNTTSAQIERADIAYRHATSNSSLFWTYANFSPIGSKKYPLLHKFGFATNLGGNSRSAEVTLKLSTPKTSSDWDTKSEVSSKYRKVEVKDLLRKLTSLQ